MKGNGICSLKSASIRRFAQPENPFAEDYGSSAHNDR